MIKTYEHLSRLEQGRLEFRQELIRKFMDRQLQKTSNAVFPLAAVVELEEAVDRIVAVAYKGVKVTPEEQIDELCHQST